MPFAEARWVMRSLSPNDDHTAVTILLFLAACFLAYSNGANDNFKGVASLYGSRTTSYRIALGWATITTFAGSIAAIFLAQALLKAFSGRGLVPDRVAGTPDFLLTVAVGAGFTVIAVTMVGFPISTTHALTGAIIGSGVVAAGRGVNFGALGNGFLLPPVLSPVLAVAAAALFYTILRWLRLRLEITKEWCVCVGETQQLIPIPQPASAMALQVATAPVLEISMGQRAECSERYAGRFLGIQSQQLMDTLHLLSAGVVSFARRPQ